MTEYTLNDNKKGYCPIFKDPLETTTKILQQSKEKLKNPNLELTEKGQWLLVTGEESQPRKGSGR